MTHLRDLFVLFSNIIVDLLVVEARQGRLYSMALPHLEVLAEVLVSAPPVGPDHTQTLVPAHLVEVRVAHIVLLPVYGESAVSVGCTLHLVDFSQSVAPVLNHSLLLYAVELTMVKNSYCS